MKIELIARNPNAPHKRVRLRYFKRRDTVRVMCHGIPLSEDGKRILFTAGDEIPFRIGKGCKLRFLKDNALKLDPGKGGRYLFYTPTRGAFRVNDTKRVCFTVRAPTITLPPLVMEGIGPYGAPTGWGATAKQRAMRRWIDETAKAGMTAMRVIPLACSWAPNQPMIFYHRTEMRNIIDDSKTSNLSPVSKMLGILYGGFDLTELDSFWAKTFEGDLWYAHQRGVTVAIDVFDTVGLKDPRFGFHPFNSINNIHAEIVDRQPYPGGPDNQRTDAINKVEHAIKGDYGMASRSFGVLLKAYTQEMQKIIPPGHVIFDGNELTSRTECRTIVSEYLEPGQGNYPGTNLAELWTGNPISDSILDDSILFDVAYFVRQHHIIENNAANMFTAIASLAGRYPHLRFIGDNDGVGSGIVRGENGRPTYEQAKAAKEAYKVAAGQYYGGFFYKTLSIEDSVQMLRRG